MDVCGREDIEYICVTQKVLYKSTICTVLMFMCTAQMYCAVHMCESF